MAIYKQYANFRKIGESLSPSNATLDPKRAHYSYKRSAGVKDDHKEPLAIGTVEAMQVAGGDSGKTEEKEKEKERQQRAVNPMSEEEAYAFIGSLYRVSKMYKIQGFNADFTKKMFGPYILNKLSRSDGDIREAVNLWCSDPAAAEEKYGHISEWDVSCVTNMRGLFFGKGSSTKTSGRGT